MLQVTPQIALEDDELEWQPIRAQGAGGQNVNKVSSAIHLRFDVNASSLPDFYKQRLLKLRDSRITQEGVIVIKAQNHRDRERNREEALQRLQTLIRSVAATRKRRIATKPTKGSQQRRLDSKSKQGQRKALRRKPQL